MKHVDHRHVAGRGRPGAGRRRRRARARPPEADGLHDVEQLGDEQQAEQHRVADAVRAAAASGSTSDERDRAGEGEQRWPARAGRAQAARPATSAAPARGSSACRGRRSVVTSVTQLPHADVRDVRRCRRASAAARDRRARVPTLAAVSCVGQHPVGRQHPHRPASAGTGVADRARRRCPGRVVLDHVGEVVRLVQEDVARLGVRLRPWSNAPWKS